LQIFFEEKFSVGGLFLVWKLQNLEFTDLFLSNLTAVEAFYAAGVSVRAA
jgi:hypothetical protein